MDLPLERRYPRITNPLLVDSQPNYRRRLDLTTSDLLVHARDGVSFGDLWFMGYG